MKTKYILLVILSAIFFTSCEPDQFILNKRKGEMLSGLIMSSIDSVDVIADNALQFYGGGQVAIRRDRMTQFMADFTVKIEQGDGLNFAIRTVCDNFESHPGIFFDYTTTGSSVKEKGQIDLQVDSVKAKINDIKRIQILNYGKHFLITVDCDTIYNGRTQLPATEYILIKSIKNTKAIITGISFVRTDSDE